MRNQLGMSLLAGLAAMAGLGNVSCSKVDCGDGTVERDGTCFPVDENPDTANCAPGTVLGAMGCEVETPTQCDPDTTAEQFDEETGITTCVGTSGGCGTELPCAAPDAGKTSLCGRIWDTETDTPIAPATGATGTRCDPAAPAATGPCSLQVKFYDALDFASNPGAATPLVVPGGAFWDDCGRYKGINIPGTTFGFVGMGVDDADAGSADLYRNTGVATDEDVARPGTGFRAYATRVTTDQKWTTSAALSGQTFAQRGVLAVVFRYHDAPVAGVSLRRAGADITDAQDFYFTDTGIARTTIADPIGNVSAVDETGTNGTALGINPGAETPVNHDGTGGLPGGCQWPVNLAASIPNVVFVQIKNAEQPGGAACP
jgi:hypothetical protein